MMCFVGGAYLAIPSKLFIPCFPPEKFISFNYDFFSLELWYKLTAASHKVWIRRYKKGVRIVRCYRFKYYLCKMLFVFNIILRCNINALFPLWTDCLCEYYLNINIININQLLILTYCLHQNEDSFFAFRFWHPKAQDIFSIPWILLIFTHLLPQFFCHHVRAAATDVTDICSQMVYS